MDKRFVLTGLLVLCMFTGCTLFRSTDYKMPDLPTLPEPPADLQEAERAALQYADDVLGLVALEGAQPAQPLVQQGQETARAGRARLGAPAEPLALPPVTERSAEADDVIATIRAALLAHRGDEVQWRRDYGQARGEPMAKETVVGSLSPWTVALIALLVAVAVVLIVKLPSVLVWVANVWRTARAAREIIVGVQEFKDEDAALTEKRALGAQLTKNTSATTKAAIKRIKKEEGV